MVSRVKKALSSLGSITAKKSTGKSSSQNLSKKTINNFYNFVEVRCDVCGKKMLVYKDGPEYNECENCYITKLETERSRCQANKRY